MFYSGSFLTTNSTTGTPAMDFKAASYSAPRAIELGINIGVATASSYGIGRSATPTTQTGTSVLIAEDGGNTVPGQTTVATSWTNAPSIPATFIRRAFISASSVGQTIIFTFPRGLNFNSSTNSLVFWNQSAQSTSTNIWAVIDE